MTISRPVRGRSLRSELLLWQLGSLLLVIVALGGGTVLFTQNYVRSQFLDIRKSQAEAVLHGTDLALGLQDAADEQTRDDWMAHWREQGGAALLAGWNERGEMSFDALTLELAHAFIGEGGQPLFGEGEGVLNVEGEPYYWRSEVLFGGQQLAGQAVVAFSLPSRMNLLQAVTQQQFPLILGALAFALLSSWLMWRRLRRTLLDLEPADIAALTVRQRQLLSTVPDGVMLVDAAGMVTLVNEPAAQALGQPDLPGHLKQVWPQLAALPTGEELRRWPLPLAGRVVLVNLTPLREGGFLVALTDREEATRLAEQLTDTRRFIDAMRARTHEYGNRLHIIAGFLQLGRNSEALQVIQDELEAEVGLNQALAAVAEPRVAALLAGKAARAHELRLTLIIEPESEVPLLSPVQADTLVTALGNYIENAFEASAGEVRVGIGLDPYGLSAEVRDDGPGVPAGLNPFAPGQTSKGAGRGQGLAGVAALAQAVGGEVWHERQGPWTVFGLNLPLE
ncbi:hypothetical protein GCM10017783_13850 [Deinococcus piscis]|uniref:histidine kinase n=1 Tax=Deinococcus piscis TaxID=394230 RepID=A0ABQ3K692_9DEIO|nr:ATP-binding protein [Deinococcus piscis]GHG02791.1 hypothetical protein GCM10017783_13850 [Deinococcus piscis]